MNKKEWKELLIESAILGIVGIFVIIVVSNLLKTYDRLTLIILFIILFLLAGLILKTIQRKKK